MPRGRIEASCPAKKSKRLYHQIASVIRLRPKYANQIWAIDFVHDKLSNGRPYKMFTALDEYTREGLCVVVATKMGAADVVEALYPLLLKRGKPEYIRSNNGPEFAATRSTFNQTQSGEPSPYEVRCEEHAMR